MVDIERWFAAAVLVLCVGLLARLAIGEPRRQRFDAALARHAGRARRAFAALRLRLFARRAARRAAAAAIERARRRDEVERDGNVRRPKSFGKPPRKLH